MGQLESLNYLSTRRNFINARLKKTMRSWSYVKRKSNVWNICAIAHLFIPWSIIKWIILGVRQTYLEMITSYWATCFPVQLICGLPAHLDIDLPQIPLSYFSPTMLWTMVSSPQKTFQKLVSVWLITRSTVSRTGFQLSPDLAEFWIIMADFVFAVVTWIRCQTWSRPDRANHRKFIAIMFYPKRPLVLIM